MHIYIYIYIYYYILLYSPPTPSPGRRSTGAPVHPCHQPVHVVHQREVLHLKKTKDGLSQQKAGSRNPLSPRCNVSFIQSWESESILRKWKYLSQGSVAVLWFLLFCSFAFLLLMIVVMCHMKLPVGQNKVMHWNEFVNLYIIYQYIFINHQHSILLGHSLPLWCQ